MLGCYLRAWTAGEELGRWDLILFGEKHASCFREVIAGSLHGIGGRAHQVLNL